LVFEKEEEMKWQVIDGVIEANSKYHDGGTPFRWWIVEQVHRAGTTCKLYATKELLPSPKKFHTVLAAMDYAEANENS
jgi:hypothetical protein